MKVFSYLLPLVWLFIAIDFVNAQGDEDINLSLTQDDNEAQKDNEFPLDPEPDSDLATTEQSEKLLTTETEATTEKSELEVTITETPSTNETKCPDKCMCILEDVGKKFTVDCSSNDLTELPDNIDPRTNVLNFQNNKIAELPLTISDLNELEVLDVANNQITGITSGSIGNLKKLRVLNVSNNNLTELPQELKEATELQALEELDLSGNDIGNINVSDILHLTGIQEIKLPESIENVTIDNFCESMAKLKKVCFGDCAGKVVKCDQRKEDESGQFLAKQTSDVTLTETNNEMEESEATATTTEAIFTENNIPSTLEFDTGVKNTDEAEIEQSSDLPNEDLEKNITEGPIKPSDSDVTGTDENTTEDSNASGNQDKVFEANSNINNQNLTGDNTRKNILPDGATALNISESEKSENLPSIQNKDAQIQATVPTIGKDETESQTTLEGGKVGEVVTNSSKGGVDNNVIGLIIGAMIVIVAGVTIKKNWSTIRRKCGGRPRPDPSHPNGIPPEEMPLKDKSPA